MTVSLSDLDFLTSDAGARLLAQLAHEDLSDASMLRQLTRLRRDHTPAHAGAALTLARLRSKGVEKFGADAARMFFTADALEQASDPLIRHWRHRWIASMDTSIVDACCGIGADLLAFASGGAQVTGVEIDPVRAQMARLNVAALGQRADVLCADVREGLPDAQLAFFDPARRADGRRLHHVEAYQPPLSVVRTWPHPQIAVKLSPGVDLAELAEYGGDVVFVSVYGDLKEAVLRLTGTGKRTALLLHEDAAWMLNAPDVDLDAVIDAPRSWLCEPDAAAIRAGLVRTLAAQANGALLDETIAYFTTAIQPNSPWLRAWQIETWMPFSVKRLREYLRERNVGSVTVKKRGTAVTPEILIPQLKLKGDHERVIVLTRLRGQQIAIVCTDG
ncbi:MAG: methyltransferase domain-containing protein [Chloroflexota bacterium]|nr:methyltransferase domain-containing protein [Chloroflexota bacterium]